MKLQAKIQTWGNSLALRISGPIKTIPHFKKNMIVEVEITEAGIHVKPLEKIRHKKLLYTEEQLIKGLTPRLAHADELAEITKKELG